MMKCLKKILMLISAASVFGFISCNNGISNNSYSDGDSRIVDNSPTSYTGLSVGRAYMGGSLVYNTDPSTNQLSAGTLIGVREGSIASRIETREVYEYDEHMNPNETYDTSSLSAVSRDIIINEDVPSEARYGYIRINSAGSDSISFTYTRYNSNGYGTSTSSYRLKCGESVDVNGDGIADLTYREPNAIRDGFEDARWLEFICNSQTDKNKVPCTSTTMMFSLISKEENSRAMVRSADGATAAVAEYGLYGVNSNGDYIFIYKDNGSVNTNGGSDPDSIAEAEDLKYGDFVILVNEDTATNANVDDSVQSYVVSYGSQSQLLSLNNKSFFNAYSYSFRQFQSVKGPKDLLKRMPAALLKIIFGENTDIDNLSAEECITALNKILEEIEAGTVTDILLNPENGLVKEEIGDESKGILNQLIEADRVKAIRRIIDSLYTQSPNADLLSPSIESMYPYLALDLGDSVSRTADVESSDLLTRSASRMAASVSDFESQKKAIKNKFAQYFAIELKKVDLGKKKDKDGNIEKDEDGNDKIDTRTLSDYGVTLALGIKGSLSISGSQVKAGIGGVLYMDIGLSLVEKAFDQIKEPLEEMLKKEIKQTVMVGAVPITVGVDIKFGLDLELETDSGKPLDLAFGYVGMYGAGITAGANWGWHWVGEFIFKAFVPYIDFFANPYTVNETAWYFGSATGDISDYKEVVDSYKSRVNAILTPSVTITPKVGLGPSWANFNVGVPIKPGLPLQFYLYTYAPVMPVLHEIDLELTVSMKAAVDIKVLVFSLHHSFFDKKIIDYTGNKRWCIWKNENI